MVEIDWNKFRVIHSDYQKSFEELCYYLFCREHKAYFGISAYHNQPGIETEPVEIEGKLLGFQSKFFEDGIDYSQIKKSVTKALKIYKLNMIYVYLNRPSGRDSRSRKTLTRLLNERK